MEERRTAATDRREESGEWTSRGINRDYRENNKLSVVSPTRLASLLSNCRKHFSPPSEIFRCFGQSANSRSGAAQKSKAMTDDSRVLDRDRSNRVKKRSLAASLGTEETLQETL